MDTKEFLKKGKEEYGDVFEEVMHYASGMLCRGVSDLNECIDIIQELDDYSYVK